VPVLRRRDDIGWVHPLPVR